MSTICEELLRTCGNYADLMILMCLDDQAKLFKDGLETIFT